MAKKKAAADPDAPEKPKSDAYVGMLVITLVAVLAGCVLMYLDHDEISRTALKAPESATVVTPTANGLMYNIAPAKQ